MVGKVGVISFRVQRNFKQSRGILLVNKKGRYSFYYWDLASRLGLVINKDSSIREFLAVF